MHNFYKLRVASVFSVVLLAFLSVIVLAIDSQAEAVQAKWPWSAGQYTVYSSTPISSVGPSWCQPLIFQQRNVAGLEGVKEMCMSSDENTHFGLYKELAGFEAAISFGGDDKLHRIINICKSSDECLYLPGTDTLVRKEYLTGTAFLSLVVYKNFTKRLSAIFNPISLADEYSFDGSRPDYIFKDEVNNRAWLIGGVGASTNGKWLALEFHGSGIGLLDIETLQMKRISSASFTYDAGYHHLTEFAVSNDGGHVVRMGFDSGLLIIDTDSSCGDIPTRSNMNGSADVVNRCLVAPTSYGFISNFKYGTLPKFSDDGGQLSFVATSRTNSVEPRQVVLRAFSYLDSRLDYLALGDSYSSGEGEIDDEKYIIGTNIEHEKCHTSMRSYPFVVSGLMGVDPAMMKSVACSGARTIDIIGETDLYMGQGGRLGVGHLNLGAIDLLATKTTALSNFLPGRILQSDFVSEYAPKVITVGIGGNDAGFMGKLTACLGPTTCKWAATDKGREQTAVEIKNLFSTLVDTYTGVHNKSPNSKIYAVGYPKIIEQDGECGGLVGFLFDKTEREFIVENIQYLNQVISAAAGAAGIKYVDIYNSLGDHTLCGLDKVGAINAVMLGDDLGLLGDFKWLRFIGQESFHPNPLGHALTATKIISQIGSLLSYDHCGGAIICPNGQSVPEPLSALLPGGYHDYPVQKNVNFASAKKSVVSRAAKMSENNGNLDYIISMPDNSFKPNSSVVFEIDNAPSVKKALSVSNTGSLDFDVSIPKDLEEIYIVMHLVGDSYSGQSVDYYQTVRYFMPDYVADEAPPSDDENSFDFLVSLFMPPESPNGNPVPPDTSPKEPVDDDQLPVAPPTFLPLPTTDERESIKSPIAFMGKPEPVVTGDGLVSAQVGYQKEAEQELAVATSNPEVKGATTVKTTIKPAAKNNNLLRDWLIPRLGYGLMAAMIVALIIIRIKKTRNLKK